MTKQKAAPTTLWYSALTGLPADVYPAGVRVCIGGSEQDVFDDLADFLDDEDDEELATLVARWRNRRDKPSIRKAMDLWEGKKFAYGWSVDVQLVGGLEFEPAEKRSSSVRLSVRVEELRQAKGLSLGKWAAKAGVGETTVSRARAGLPVARRSAERLARALGVLPASVIKSEGELVGEK